MWTIYGPPVHGADSRNIERAQDDVTDDEQLRGNRPQSALKHRVRPVFTEQLLPFSTQNIPALMDDNFTVTYTQVVAFGVGRYVVDYMFGVNADRREIIMVDRGSAMFQPNNCGPQFRVNAGEAFLAPPGAYYLHARPTEPETTGFSVIRFITPATDAEHESADEAIHAIAVDTAVDASDEISGRTCHVGRHGSMGAATASSEVSSGMNSL
jgi:hypothetical protein